MSGRQICKSPFFDILSFPHKNSLRVKQSGENDLKINSLSHLGCQINTLSIVKVNYSLIE